jgi:hypothetical protein
MRRILVARGLMFIALGLLGACKPAPAWSRLVPGQKGDETIAGTPLAVPRAHAMPTLDGALDDAAWNGAALLGPFVDPGGGGDAGKSPVKALARMTWDDKNLYLGVVVADASPVSTFGHDDVDPHIWGASSGIELMMQPGDPGDNRDYYELQVDVNGAVFDSHFDDYNAPITGTGPDKRFGHQEFESHVQRAVYKGRGFYAIELAYPWSSLAPARVAVPPKAGDVWRINLYSFRDGQRHALAWSPLRGRGNFHRAERFGRIKFTD